MAHSTFEIVIEGVVQGVGFRPFVYRLAHKMGLCGEVRNDAQGVRITLQADLEQFKRFTARLQEELPPLARIDRVTYERSHKIGKFEGFRIVSSDQEGEIKARIPPDTALCKACTAELYDPSNRRFRYPFMTCTDCGVRYSIIERLPYDRPNTSMRFFAMCKACEAEYRDPANRRYHAQPIGCFDCGPRLSLRIGAVPMPVQDSDEIIAQTARLLREGKIVALKGVGGFHLMCDATNDDAVARLRARKRRPHKPFAIMVRTLDEAKRYAHIGRDEASLLASPERPVVLLRAKKHTPLSDAVAPGVAYVGIMLPYTALHMLLLDEAGVPLVATSANLSGAPICSDEEGLSALSGVYDAVLTHDRIIVNRCDDSVVTVVGGRQVMLRRARGYAPASLSLPFALDVPTLALGAHQKNTVAIGFGDQAILSPYIGDLEHIEAQAFFEQNVRNLRKLYAFTPQCIVHDAHPRYASTRFAKRLAVEGVDGLSRSDDNTKALSLEVRTLYHHHAHMAAVMAEHGLEGEVCAIVWDGTGLGEDGTLWGGECLVGGYERYKRAGHWKPFRLLGGEKAIKEPRRVALALLFELYGETALFCDTPARRAFDEAQARLLYEAWRKAINAPLSSSAGRLFDAVASLLGVCHVMSYEAQSGLMLEALYEASVEGHYPFEIANGVVAWDAMVAALLEERDVRVGVSRFFHTLIEVITALYAPYTHLPLVCSGGVFQNRVLVELLLRRFPDALLPERFPPNDGGIALGQIVASCQKSPKR